MSGLQRVSFPFWVRFSLTSLGFRSLRPRCSLSAQRSSGDAPLFQEPPKISQVTKDKFLVLSKIKLFPLVNFHQMSSLIWKQDVAHEEREVRLPVHLHWSGAERKPGEGGRHGQGMAFIGAQTFMEWTENQWNFKSETQNSESFSLITERPNRGHIQSTSAPTPTQTACLWGPWDPLLVQK